MASGGIDMDDSNDEHGRSRVGEPGRHLSGARRARLGGAPCDGDCELLGIHLYYDASRRIVAQVRDGKPVQTYDPYEALYEWPLFVGKSWVSNFQIREYARDQTTSLRYDFRVEVIEEATTPAGVFKTFRIRRDSPDDRYVVWFDPELGIEVKRDWERFASHRLGSGTNKLELLSHDVKPGAR
jgi:hypothetical protein